MADLVLAYDILNETQADAVPVQSNYERIEAHVNGNVIRTDGATVMAAPLQLFGDPINANDAVRKGFLDLLMPVGVILPYGGSAVPGGLWALANGADMSTTVYPALYAAIGFNFGGAGSTFKLPDLRGRTMMGQSAAAPFAALNTPGGNKDAVVVQHQHATPNHTHTITEHTHWVSQHSHPINVYTGNEIGAHSHGPANANNFIASSDGGSYWFNFGAGDKNIYPTGATIGESAVHHHAINSNTDSNALLATSTIINGAPASGGASPNTNDAGVGGTDKNLPPYIVINFIVRVS